MTGTPAVRTLDPRTGLLLLCFSNCIAFTQRNLAVEGGWIVFLGLMMALYGCGADAVKFTGGFALILCLQWYILPASPKLVATTFSIFVNYARRLFPCLMVGAWMLRRTPLRHLIVGLRLLHCPQRLIVAVSVTLRYFPAIREEAGYIHDAMRLRGLQGPAMAEYMIVPLMVSATGTADELSAAAVTRGIEDPVKKTSLVTLKLSPLDGLCIAAGTAFTLAAFLVR